MTKNVLGSRTLSVSIEQRSGMGGEGRGAGAEEGGVRERSAQGG